MEFYVLLTIFGWFVLSGYVFQDMQTHQALFVLVS